VSLAGRKTLVGRLAQTVVNFDDPASTLTGQNGGSVEVRASTSCREKGVCLGDACTQGEHWVEARCIIFSIVPGQHQLKQWQNGPAGEMVYLLSHNGPPVAKSLFPGASRHPLHTSGSRELRPLLCPRAPRHPDHSTLILNIILILVLSVAGNTATTSALFLYKPRRSDGHSPWLGAFAGSPCWALPGSQPPSPS